MIKKNKVVVFIFVILIVLGIGFGGKLYMEKKAEEKVKEEQILQAKKNIALFVVQNYSDVKSIKFSEFKYNTETGSWHVSAKVNQDNLITFSLERIDKVNVDSIGTRINPATFKLEKLENRNKTLNDIDILKEN
ncbi:hypothetical protein ATZ33_10325 [Enterococcus silesiacus]|uniref:DUF1433 domain-containing protein n=1 Tax=Enterococcus silesiacus TaxID=332949 RepID=A0A0S3KBS6_9ENTE|nr:hypothetical protein [Enterococcus silesiacus]ALS01755.1 hypothetical protein ATZ33_10325 [Enterococcus silesiacus]OJG87565.1 hypothetical protein RV15_GL001958 [Enterococcus silesiacus]